MPEQKPTVGRVIHFAYGDTPCAAIVTGVFDEKTVDYFVMTPSALQGKAGPFFTGTAPFNADGEPGTWRYPPRA